MSYDVSLEYEEVDDDGKVTQSTEAWWRNMTSNVSSVWSEALGIEDKSLGMVIEDSDGDPKIIGPLCHEAALKIDEDPESYRSFVRGGGEWGTVEGASSYLHDIANACAKYPTAKVRVSR